MNVVLEYTLTVLAIIVTIGAILYSASYVLDVVDDWKEESERRRRHEELVKAQETIRQAMVQTRDYETPPMSPAPDLVDRG